MMICADKLVSVVIFIGVWRCAICALGADAPPASCVEEQVLDLFTRWRQGEELPFPLPSIKAIQVPAFSGVYNGYGLKISQYDTGEMRLTGFDNFTVEELFATTHNLLEASGTIQFPVLNLTADNYSLKGRAYVFYNLKGSGRMYVTFRGVKLMYDISLGSHGDGTKVDHVQFDYSFESVQIHLEDSSWPINKVLNSQAKGIVDSYHTTLVVLATEMATEALNRRLAAVTPGQVTSVITNCTEARY